MMEVLIWEGTERWRKSGGDGECGVRVKEEKKAGDEEGCLVEPLKTHPGDPVH